MKFIHNKYYTWYFNIIYKANDIKIANRTEHHHVLPKSLFPEYKSLADFPWNGVHLTHKEHFICHLLLLKFTAGNDKSKMINAAWAMANLKTKDQFRRKVNSRTYSILREQFANQHAIWRTGQKHSSETKAKISIANKGNPSKLKGVPRTDIVKSKISNSCKGKPKSEEHKAKLSKLWSGENNPNYGKTWSDETRLKISQARLQTKKIKCIHCNREIDPGNFKRFHGDMCKLNISSPRYKV